jgi:hypothetical protein
MESNRDYSRLTGKPDVSHTVVRHPTLLSPFQSRDHRLWQMQCRERDSIAPKSPPRDGKVELI